MTSKNSFPDSIITRRDLLASSAALGVGAAVGVTFWSSKAAAETPRRGGKLIVGVKGGSSSDSLDPTLIPSQAAAYLTYQYGSWLIERSPEGELGGELAESWEPLEGGKRWVIKLRQGVKFHNGKEFTAEDMVYSLNRHRGPDTKSPAVSLMKPIEEITVDNPYQLTISLKEPDVGLPYLLAYIHLVAQPKDENPASAIGTGPFVLDKAEPGKRYTFHRNPNYFKPNRVWFDELEVLVINDDTARISALLSGSVHVISEVPPNLVPNLKNVPNLSLSSSPTSKFYYFVMRVDQPPFDNPDLRLALKYAVDREAILNNVAPGYGEIGNDTPINSVFPFYSNDIPKHSYDIAKAKEYYKRSGHSGPIVLHTAEVFPGAVDMSVIFQQSAAKAGITVELKREPVDGYWDNVWIKAPFCVSYWGSLTTEDQAFSMPFASGAPWNDSHWERPEFDKLLAKARAELDPVARKAIYREAAMMIHDEGGHITVMFTHDIQALSNKIQGYTIFPFGEDARNTQNCWFAS
ncbi:ABC transporter substrate-binding protein [Rhizobium calliandrae]|uniref:ABC transporter substrate-binding protein n=1 Tax=Rhizobium calliandrae TaxID=1312182 RepID=A0ABT7KPG5_9HYPH|nr:ABC transporter substrate-binding protein [Rhizobium calliandrae]MDL2410321.1 ABC transporter substrate-binding protein [Rhizobium calliandrae]